MDEIFDSVYSLLKWIESTSGLTYREVNIIVYYIVIPSFFFYLISRIIKKWYPILVFLVLVLLGLLIIPSFEQFSDNLFNKSVNFLNWFSNIGLNYVQASVFICVIAPVLAAIILYFFKRKLK